MNRSMSKSMAFHVLIFPGLVLVYVFAFLHRFSYRLKKHLSAILFIQVGISAPIICTCAYQFARVILRTWVILLISFYLNHYFIHTGSTINDYSVVVSERLHLCNGFTNIQSKLCWQLGNGNQCITATKGIPIKMVRMESFG